MRKRKIALYGVIAVFAVGLAAGLYYNRSQEVQTALAVSHEFTTFIEGAGFVSAPLQAVTAPISGRVGEITVVEGQRVNAGDVILRMEDVSLRLQYEEAVLALNAQKKEYQRQNDVIAESERAAAMLAAQTTGYGLDEFNRAAVSPAERTVGAEQVEMARIKVRQAKELLDNAAVRAAIGGVVLEVNARSGELVAAGSQAVLVASMNEAEIDSVFSDIDASSIAPGMEVHLHGGCLGTAACAGTVTELVRKAETQQSQAGLSSAAVVKVKPADTALFDRLGASVELKIITGKKRGVGVPIEALAQDASGLYVFVVRGTRAYRAPVQVGVLDEYFAEVTSGVAEGDVVALNPTELRNRMKVSNP